MNRTTATNARGKIMNGDPAMPGRIDELAEAYALRLRRGERPTLDEYVAQYPELESSIREVFPAIEMVEGLAPVVDDRADPGREVPPDRLGDYRIIREVGRGGMGIVYEAEQESLRRRVALKVFPSAHATSRQNHLQRFYREAQSAAGLHHTNIVPVFEVGHRDGTHFYAMQFIHGQDLSEVFDELKRLRRSESRQWEPELDSPLAVSIATRLFEQS